MEKDFKSFMSDMQKRKHIRRQKMEHSKGHKPMGKDKISMRRKMYRKEMEDESED